MKVKSALARSIAATLVFASGSVFAADVTKQQVVEHYADIAHAVFSDALTTAQALDTSIESFLNTPSEKNTR
ncbi:hypothetical protein VSVS05_01505 [Vibrio scophthalmi]|uniref:Uncharacterized protein n=1 Tax=Vibrio scophthalmi TaxID=45658 RepID=A0A1C7F9K8_9VIBR|nr:hypothetical protein VSVS05_01505 [Vibrio scophthalmi]